MVTTLLNRLTLAVGGLGLSLVATGIAAAAPDIGSIVNTTCSYSQVMAALNAENPAAAENFNASPVAQSLLRSFLAAPPDRRERIALQVQAMPEAQPYISTIAQVAGSCNSY